MHATTRTVDVSKYLLLTVGALTMLTPLIWMVLASFKTLPEILAFPPTLLPEQVNLDNYHAVFETADFVRYFFNSVVIAAISVVSVLLTSSMAGYAFAKFSFPGRDALFVVVLATLMIPFQVRVIPLYVLASDLSLLNTYAGMVLPTLVDAFGIFLMRQYMMSIPSELIESARVDGAGELRIFVSIVLPLAKPALSALTIFTLVMSWESFLWPLLVASTPDMYTLPLGLAQFAGRFLNRTDLQMAAATMTVVPLLIVFLLMQKRFIEGMATTGMK
ncbi:carbohydrate ABC transporter permease [Nocardioides glacieisoli]|uniref:Carbohydrate ABC transporter permease n=1 Tax=Nocardioides glacieisoli TaxID=1168730 RepID=A0A4Q2RJ02_9ACTN|nr:carbohydrate ABC transporter permease [Nocardioides glacieisoli]RYB88671.1 carbohydrate ABC transporter permease [Nocardioides glacieisoli]